jgi:hypothetical protein
MQEAGKMYENGRTRKAIVLFKDIIDRCNANVEQGYDVVTSLHGSLRAQSSIGQCHYLAGQYQEAIDASNAAVNKCISAIKDDVYGKLIFGSDKIVYDSFNLLFANMLGHLAVVLHGTAQPPQTVYELASDVIEHHSHGPFDPHSASGDVMCAMYSLRCESTLTLRMHPSLALLDAETAVALYDVRHGANSVSISVDESRMGTYQLLARCQHVLALICSNFNNRPASANWYTQAIGTLKTASEMNLLANGDKRARALLLCALHELCIGRFRKSLDLCDEVAMRMDVSVVCAAKCAFLRVVALLYARAKSPAYQAALNYAVNNHGIPAEVMHVIGKAFACVWRIFVGAYTRPPKSLVDMRLDINDIALALGLQNSQDTDGVSPRSCRQCGSMLSKSGTSLKKCGRCNEVFYCSVECQAVHWKVSHSNECIKLTPSDVDKKEDDGDSKEEHLGQDEKKETERDRTKPPAEIETEAGAVVSVCSHCNSTDKKTKRCTKCKLVRYCGLVCQKAHWHAGHKALCGK